MMKDEKLGGHTTPHCGGTKGVTDKGFSKGTECNIMYPKGNSWALSGNKFCLWE